MTWIDRTPAVSAAGEKPGRYLASDDAFPVIEWLNDPLYVHSAAAAGGMANIYWPSVIHARSAGIANPIDEYYLYMSTDHGSGGIRLWTMPTPTGPMTFQGLVFDAGGSCETPSVIYDPVLKRLNLYYQKIFGLQETGLATSTDGVNWTDVGKVMPSGGTPGGTGHTGYQTIWRAGGLWWAEGLGRSGGNSMHSRRWSLDGVTWTRDVRGTCRAADMGGPNKVISYKHPFYWRGRPMYAAIAIDYGGSGGSSTGGQLILTAATPDFRSNAGQPAIYNPTLPFQSGKARACQVLSTPDGQTYIYWQTDNNLAVGVLK